MPKTRLDVLVTERGLAESRAQAQRLIMAGAVRVNGQVADKPGALVGDSDSARVEVTERPPFVSRGGEKLRAALDAFTVDVAGTVCADVGASTGGFTDCLLQAGAARVYAIDVGRGVLDWSLRNDPRVVVMEDTNARYLVALPEPVRLVTVDASFISLKLLLPVVKGWFPKFSTQLAISPSSEGEGGHGAVNEVIALIKPQFEAGRKDVGKGGVVKDPAVHRRVLLDIAGFAEGQGYGVRGLIASPLKGPKGNVEFLLWLSVTSVTLRTELERLVDEALASIIH